MRFETLYDKVLEETQEEKDKLLHLVKTAQAENQSAVPFPGHRSHLPDILRNFYLRELENAVSSCEDDDLERYPYQLELCRKLCNDEEIRIDELPDEANLYAV